MTREDKLNDYDGFVGKFKPKKTTDDCYTPAAVYDEVLKFVGEIADMEGREVVRPFYPGGDYEHYDYPEGCVVVDNPPFSIYAKIVRFYIDRGIDFFLFAPAVTQLVMGAEVCYICTMADVVYDNGAVVRTSFTTNLVKDKRLWVCGSLSKRLAALSAEGKKFINKYTYPDNIVTTAIMGKIANRGVDFAVAADECCYVRNLDALRAEGKSLFGGGMILGRRAAAERAAAERAAAERAAACTIRLSEDELERFKHILNR